MSWSIANHIDRGLAAGRPAAGAVPGKHYGWFATDTGILSIVGAGPAWVEIGPVDISGKQPLDSDLTAIAALTTTTYGRALLTMADAAALRTAAGLGTAATSNTGDFDAAGAAAAAQAASQPLDSDLTAIAALSTTSFGRGLLIEATAASARTTLGISGAVGGVEWTTITKAGDESVTSSTTLQDDDELLFTAVNGAVYEVEAVVIYVSPLGAGTPDIKIAFGETSGLGNMLWYGVSPADAANNAFGLTSLGAIFTFGTAAVNRIAFGKGHHPGLGGSFKIQWAQNTSGGNATTVKAGSLLRYRRIL